MKPTHRFLNLFIFSQLPVGNWKVQLRGISDGQARKSPQGEKISQRSHNRQKNGKIIFTQ